VPLSEDEQRILHQIEQQFYETDPDLARTVGSTSVYRHYLRSLKWAALLCLAGLALLVATLTTNYLVSFIGFLVMLGAVLWGERCVRKLGKAGLQQLTTSMRTNGLRDYLGNTRNRMRDRFRREDEE